MRGMCLVNIIKNNNYSKEPEYYKKYRRIKL